MDIDFTEEPKNDENIARELEEQEKVLQRKSTSSKAVNKSRHWRTECNKPKHASR